MGIYFLTDIWGWVKDLFVDFLMVGSAKFLPPTGAKKNISPPPHK